MQVFISFLNSDRAAARQLATMLRAADFDVWFDEWSLLPGDLVSDGLSKAIRRSQAIVVLVSPESMASASVRSEVSFALGARQYEGRLFPVLVRDTPADQIPWILARLHILDGSSDLVRAGQQIIEQLRQSPAEQATTGT